MKANLNTPTETSSKAIIVALFEDDSNLSEVQKRLNERFNFVITNNILKNFNAKINETLVFPQDTGVKILALGLGKKEDFCLKNFREAVFKGVMAALKFAKEAETLSIATPDIDIPEKELIETILLGFNLANYKFDKYKTKKPEKFDTLEILTQNITPEAECGIKYGNIISDALDFTKNLVFESAEIMTPSKVAQIAQELSVKNNLECKIFSKNEIKEMGMGAFLAVGQGSAQEPKFIHLAYKPKNPEKKIALIGKGITFDSGGLDIKPASSMLTMKTDMSGCATVLGVIKAISEIKPNIELHAISALCENMPSGTSYKVGDVLISKSKKTIEVDNTDAEGRLTLADALTYADEIEADEVIDIATLTGAVIVALGNNITGIMGNNQTQIDAFKKVCDKTGENVWQLPIYDDMKESLKSDIADMKNTGSRGAGASVAGWFLSNFTKSKKWLHIDIAGTAYIEKPYRELQKGATGVMLRSLIEYISS